MNMKIIEDLNVGVIVDSNTKKKSFINNEGKRVIMDKLTNKEIEVDEKGNPLDKK